MPSRTHPPGPRPSRCHKRASDPQPSMQRDHVHFSGLITSFFGSFPARPGPVLGLVADIATPACCLAAVTRSLTTGRWHGSGIEGHREG